MKIFKLSGTIPALAFAVSVIASSGHASTVTPDVIFGTGNANGGFTIVEDIGNGLEIGLRAKLRYNQSGAPENTFPWDGVDTYTFNETDGNAPANRALWSFEWAVNTNTNGNGGNLDDYSYSIALTGPNG